VLPLEEHDPFAPQMQEVPVPEPVLNIFSPVVEAVKVVEPVQEEEKESMVLQFELSPEITDEVKVPDTVQEEVHVPRKVIADEMLEFKVTEHPAKPAAAATAPAAVSYLSKPSNIYASEEQVAQAPAPKPQPQPVQEELPMEMQLVEREEKKAPQAQPQPVIDDVLDDVEEQKRRAAERIHKLRNLSYNMNSAADANNEFDTVPAYVRRNMELFGNTLTSVENFYSKYTVSKDENNQAQISTINTFLDGKKPD
jgi:cell division protein FtsZ